MACSKQKDAKIVALLQKLDEGSCTQVVSAVDMIIERLEAIGLAYRLSIPPELMGVNPANRNGYGLSPVEVHALGADIVKIGWSWAACAHAVAVEDDAKQTIASFPSSCLSIIQALPKCQNRKSSLARCRARTPRRSWQHAKKGWRRTNRPSLSMVDCLLRISAIATPSCKKLWRKA